MESLIKAVLNTSTLSSYGRGGGGSINEGEGFMTDKGPIFVKKNNKAKAKLMFDGEFASLVALYATDTVKVPKPIRSVEQSSGGAFLVTEYIEMRSDFRKFASELGKQIAKLHNVNARLLKNAEKQSTNVCAKKDEFSVEPSLQFGFSTTTCCGYLPQLNNWRDNWIEFYMQQRLQPQINAVVEEYGNRELLELWPKLQTNVPKFFDACEPIVPSLLHGDLWSGNVGVTDTEAVIFDPASFFGHAEYEFGIATMFGGFPNTFYTSYFQVNPKACGYEMRQSLYQLFHQLNHWNHFGDGYKDSTLHIMRNLCK